MLRWVFSADTGPFRRGLSQMRTEGKAWSGAMTRMFAGVFSAGAVLAGFRSWLQSMDRLAKSAKALGTSFESLQRVKVLAELSGTDVETASKAMFRLATAMQEASRKGGSMAEAMRDLGINADQFVGLSVDQQILQLATALQAAQGSGMELSAFYDLIGRQSQKLIPLLQTPIAQLRAELENTNTVSGATAARIEKLNDSFTRLKQNVNVGFAVTFEGVRLIVESIGAILGNWISILGRFFDLWSTGWREAGNILKGVFDGDFGAIKAAAGRMGDAVNDTLRRIAETSKLAAADTLQNWKDAFAGVEEAAGKAGGGVPNILGSPEAIEDRRRAREEEAAALAAERDAGGPGGRSSGPSYDQRQAIELAKTSGERFAKELASIGSDRRPDFDSVFQADANYGESAGLGAIPVSSIRSIGGDVGPGGGIGAASNGIDGLLKEVSLIRARLEKSTPPSKEYSQPRA